MPPAVRRGAEQAVFERISNLEDGRIRIETTVTDEEGRQEVLEPEFLAGMKAELRELLDLLTLPASD